MPKTNRRQFFEQAGLAGAAATAEPWLERALLAESASGRARLWVDSTRQISQLDRRLFGSFLEHLGRAIYGGIYQPGSKFADANGFRTDTLAEIKKLGVPIIRYPGGNFVSGYHWLDGVGPRQNRPAVLDRAWNSLETNQFGTNEFITWARQVGTEPLFGLNFGTGSVEMAAALVEYCNVEKGTKWSNLRREHGYQQPHNIRYWCLGNEMDGPWQIGHMGASEYGHKAADAARQIRRIDPSLKLIACGSSGPFMPTYLDWDRQVLEECYSGVDAISLHRYIENTEETDHDSSRYMAMNLSMDRQIAEITAVCDMVRGREHSGKQLWLSFDEWNVFNSTQADAGDDGRRQPAPHLAEEIYNLEDALVVGGMVNTLLRRSDRVRIACQAQLVNAVAPILTNDNGLLRQSIYYPYAWGLAEARGNVLDLALEAPVYEVPDFGEAGSEGRRNTRHKVPVPYLDVAGTLDAAAGKATLLILNRDLEKACELEVVWRDLTPKKVNSCQVLTGPDLKAFNSFESPNRVVPQALNAPGPGSRMTFELPARSYTMVSLAL